MSENDHFLFRATGEALAARGGLAEGVDADAFAEARAYAAGACKDIEGAYRLLVPAVVNLDPVKAAAVERALGRPGACPSAAAAREGMLAAVSPVGVPAAAAHRLSRLRFRRRQGGFFAAYGYAHLGPVLAAYAGWAGARCRSAGRPVFAGVLRDGGLLARAVATLHPELAPDHREVWLSRRLSLVAAIGSADDREGLRNLLLRARARPATLAEAMADLGLADEAPPSGLAGATRLQGAAFETFLAWLDGRGRRERLANHTRRLRRAILAHLRSRRIPDEGPLVLLDVGYAGNVQRCLAAILALEGRERPLIGLHLATSPGAVWAGAARRSAIAGCLLNYGSPRWLNRPLLKARALLEVLLAQPAGSLQGYADDGPVLGSVACPKSQAEAVAALQEGALDFVRDWREECRAPGPLPLPDLVGRARLVLLRMLAMPLPEEAERLGHWVYADALSTGEARPLVAGGEEAAPWPTGAAALAGATASQLLMAVVSERLDE